MRKVLIIAVSIATVASSVAFPQEPKLAPEGRGLLPRPPAATRESPAEGRFSVDPSGVLSRTVFETDDDPNFRLIFRDFSFPPDKQPHTITLPSAAFLHVLSGKGEISVAKQKDGADSAVENAGGARRRAHRSREQRRIPDGPERSDRGSKIAMLAIVRSISAHIFCFLFAVAAANAAQDDWLTYRHDSARTGTQPFASDLSDPAKISDLHVVAQFPPEGSPRSPGGFKASPIVVDGTAFIGGVDGYFYAFDAASGTPKWQYPRAVDHPDRFVRQANRLAGGWGSYGIPSSATYAKINGQDAVIFGAPDPEPREEELGAPGFSPSRSRPILTILSLFGKATLLRTSIVRQEALFTSELRILRLCS